MFNAILVVTDRATRVCHLIATNKYENAQENARLILPNVVRLHGLTRSIISDQDSRLTSEWWQELPVHRVPSTDKRARGKNESNDEAVIARSAI